MSQRHTHTHTPAGWISGLSQSPLKHYPERISVWQQWEGGWAAMLMESHWVQMTWMRTWGFLLCLRHKGLAPSKCVCLCECTSMLLKLKLPFIIVSSDIQYVLWCWRHLLKWERPQRRPFGRCLHVWWVVTNFVTMAASPRGCETSKVCNRDEDEGWIRGWVWCNPWLLSIYGSQRPTCWSYCNLSVIYSHWHHYNGSL